MRSPPKTPAGLGLSMSQCRHMAKTNLVTMHGPNNLTRVPTYSSCQNSQQQPAAAHSTAAHSALGRVYRAAKHHGLSYRIFSIMFISWTELKRSNTHGLLALSAPEPR